MPRIPILRLRRGEAPPPAPQLASYQPKIDFKELVPGIDNLRHDVVFSSKSLEAVRKHVSSLIARQGDVERVLAEDAPVEARKELFIRRTTAAPSVVPVQPRAADLKPLLMELHVAALNAAKAKENLSVDLLGRVAIVKFLRAAISEQFAEVLERCRTRFRWRKKRFCGGPRRRFFSICVRSRKKRWPACDDRCSARRELTGMSCC
jgi:hypothetical protein